MSKVICQFFKVSHEAQVPRTKLVNLIEYQNKAIQQLRFELYVANPKHAWFLKLPEQEREIMELGRLQRKKIKISFKDILRKLTTIRFGKCNHCGECCTGPDNKVCEFLKNNKCIVYGKRPAWCNKDFPRTQKELDEKGVKCSYHFISIFKGRKKNGK